MSTFDNPAAPAPAAPAPADTAAPAQDYTQDEAARAARGLAAALAVPDPVAFETIVATIPPTHLFDVMTAVEQLVTAPAPVPDIPVPPVAASVDSAGSTTSTTIDAPAVEALVDENGCSTIADARAGQTPPAS